MAPILHFSNPDRQLITYVNASSVGVQDILFQWQELFPFAFFHHCSIPADRNYDRTSGSEFGPGEMKPLAGGYQGVFLWMDRSLQSRIYLLSQGIELQTSPDVTVL